MDVEPPLGEVLRGLRLTAGMTQEELAQRSGVSVRAISDVERSRTSRPYPRSVRLLCAGLGLPEEKRDRLLRAARSGSPAPACPGGEAAGEAQVGIATAGNATIRGADFAGAQRLNHRPTAPPRQLPCDIADFTGREKQTAKLCELLTGLVWPPARVTPPGGAVPPALPEGPCGAVAVAVVAGQGGIGKTALAVHAAHRVAARYPDGQLYVDLRVAGGQGACVADVLARFLRDLGMAAEAVPAGPDERAAAYRSLLAGRRVLVVLDDARGAAEVRPLLPGAAGCAVLVTSRGRLTELDGVRVLELGMLPAGEARALFTRIVGRPRAAPEPEAVRKVLAACAGLPLAVRIAAARLAGRPAWRIGDLARRLTSERRMLDELTAGDRSVRASCEVSYAALAPDAAPAAEPAGGVDPARVFRLLGIWGSPSISLPAAAALVGRAEPGVAVALEALADACLLESRARCRYQLHDLVRAYAAERARGTETVPDRRAAAGRLVRWYARTARAATGLLEPRRDLPELGPATCAGPGARALTFPDYGRAVHWYEDELAGLVAATRLAAACGLDELAWKVPVISWSFFRLRPHWAQWAAMRRIALASARRAADQHGEAWVLNLLRPAGRLTAG